MWAKKKENTASYLWVSLFYTVCSRCIGRKHLSCCITIAAFHILISHPLKQYCSSSNRNSWSSSHTSLESVTYRNHLNLQFSKYINTTKYTGSARTKGGWFWRVVCRESHISITGSTLNADSKESISQLKRVVHIKNAPEINQKTNARAFTLVIVKSELVWTAR